MTYRLKGSALILPFLGIASLSACVSQEKYDAVVAENQQLRGQNEHVNRHLDVAQSHIGRLHDALTYVVNSDLLFKSGSWEMSEDGKDNIADIAKMLAPNQSEKLVVTGYTDDTPIGPALKRQGVTTNQELSQKRAEAVVQFMISQGVNPSLVSAQGAGEAKPIAPNDSTENKAKNRRVEVSLTGSSA